MLPVLVGARLLLVIASKSVIKRCRNTLFSLCFKVFFVQLMLSVICFQDFIVFICLFYFFESK